MNRQLFGSFWLALLVACAGNVPDNIRTPPPGAVALDEARAQLQRFQGSRVRWGGVIVTVANRAADTEIEIVGRALAANGRPQETDRSPGRFLARVAGFLDPLIYTKGRLLTVTGVLAGAERRAIGQYHYEYPVVQVETHYLWEPLPEYDAYEDVPFWYYDPWYRPPYLYPYPLRRRPKPKTD